MEQGKSFTLLIETSIKKEVEFSLSLSKEDGSSLVFLICGWSRPLVLIYALKDLRKGPFKPSLCPPVRYKGSIQYDIGQAFFPRSVSVKRIDSSKSTEFSSEALEAQVRKSGSFTVASQE